VKPNRIKGKQTSGKFNCSSLPSTFFFHPNFRRRRRRKKNDGRHVKDPPSLFNNSIHPPRRRRKKELNKTKNHPRKIKNKAQKKESNYKTLIRAASYTEDSLVGGGIGCRISSWPSKEKALTAPF
jgi:hypothetical protein